MSTLTYGPPVRLDGPLPQPPPYSLLQTPGVLVEEDSDRWINGATIHAYPVDEPEAWDPCTAGTTRVKSEGGSTPLPIFGAFVAFLPITCSAMSIGDPDDFSHRAEIALDAVESFIVEQVLASGISTSANPFLGDTELDILGGATVTPAVGLRYLENAIGLSGRKGMLHATPAVGAAWGFASFETGALLETANGTPVVLGGGYIGADPVAGSAPDPDNRIEWAFASGPVQVRHSEVITHEDISEALDTSNNDVTFRAERYVLVTWDKGVQAGVRIDWST